MLGLLTYFVFYGIVSIDRSLKFLWELRFVGRNKRLNRHLGKSKLKTLFSTLFGCLNLLMQLLLIQAYINLFAMSSLAMSQVEKHFVTNQIYKRSRRYFDVARLNSIEHHEEKQRRKPCNSCKKTIQNKIQLSFISSQEFYNQRRAEQLYRLKKKGEQDDEIQTNYSFATKTNLKSFDMDKHLSRQFFTSKKQAHGIQNQFDNYFIKNITKPKGRSFDFSKFMGRKSENKNKEQVKNPQKQKKQDQKTKTVHQVNKEYEKIVFNDALFRCLFSDDHQKKRGKHQQKSKLSTSILPKQLEIQSVQKGRRATQKNVSVNYYPFYNGKGKQQASQMHMKCLKQNTNYWKQEMKTIKEQDFQIAKRKEDMILKRISDIKKRKVVQDDKDQMCSQKFFRRYKQDLNEKRT